MKTMYVPKIALKESLNNVWARKETFAEGIMTGLALLKRSVQKILRAF